VDRLSCEDQGVTAELSGHVCTQAAFASRICSIAMQANRALALVAPYCDIVERIGLVPPSAQVRGLWLNAIERQVERRGSLAVYREYFPDDHYSTLGFYPLADVLVRLACSGAIVASPERVHEGMSAIMRGNAEAFVDTLLGRVMLRVLSRDPVKLFEQGIAARRQSFTYGRWELRRLGDREIEVAHHDEYIWIESALAGAAAGTFAACNLNGEFTTKLVDRFNGSIFVRWS
jgi:uncharacterized protein (TIGR02265 family)